MKKKFFIGLFIVAAIGLFIFAGIVLKKNPPAQTQNETQNLQAPIEIPATGILSYVEATKSDKPLLVMFYVDWCTYCRRFMPLFGALSVYYKDNFTFAVVNCDLPENQEIIQKYPVSGYPSLYVIDKKYDFDYIVNHTAFIEKNVMDRELQKYLKLREKLDK